MRTLAYVLGLAVAVAIAGPTFAAAGSFPDVPPDHWAYDAVNDLQEKGIIHGYPTGYFDGKKTLTRYEFAVAIDRMLPWIMKNIRIDPSTVQDLISKAGLVKQSELQALEKQLQDALANKADKSEIQRLQKAIDDLKGVSPAEGVAELKKTVDSIRRLVEEFKDDLANIGVEVEAVKKDIKALHDEVNNLKGMMKSVPTFSGTGHIGALGTATRADSLGEAYGFPVAGQHFPFDWDPLTNMPTNNVLHNVGRLSLYDFDLGMKSKIGDDVTAEAVLNVGNYLSWLSGNNTTDDYKVTPWIFDAKMPVTLGPLGSGTLTMGKFPVQYTKYTLMWGPPDYYLFTDKWTQGPYAGGYPVFGALVQTKVGNVDLTTHVATHDNVFFPALPMNTSVGGRATIAAGPGNGKFGVTVLYAGIPATTNAPDRLGVLGADWNGQLAPSFDFGVEYAKYYEIIQGVSRPVDTDNAALDARVHYHKGDLGLMAGYVDIEKNFAAPGYWGRFGRTVNLADVSGPVAEASYTFSPNFTANVGIEAYQKGNTTMMLGYTYPKGNVTRYYGGFEWGFKSDYSFKVEAEQIIWDPDMASRNPAEGYLTFEVGHAWNENASLRLLYQVVDWKGKNVNVPYGTALGTDYKGALVGAQVGVRF
jgi:hypothetical protein